MWTTFMGIHFVDIWKLSRFRLSLSHHLAKDSVIDLSENLAYALVNNHLSQDTKRRTIDTSPGSGSGSY
jgi:hypothetical protein